MPFFAETLGLSDQAFSLLRDLIHERTGLCYEDGKSDILADRLSGRVLEYGFDSFLDYYYLLRYDPAGAEEWQRVIDLLAVPETFFWREIDQVSTLVDVLVPQHFARPGAGPLRIWSAACASGEEPLSIAMALDQAGWLARAPVEICASDASPAAIERCRAGVYRERAFRNLPPALEERYFRPVAGGQRVDPALQARIQWSIANLMAPDEIAGLAAADIIFCRNVFIYFSIGAICKVVQLFGERMPTPGYLFLGASESLLRVATRFELEEIGEAFVYVKR